MELDFRGSRRKARAALIRLRRAVDAMEDKIAHRARITQHRVSILAVLPTVQRLRTEYASQQLAVAVDDEKRAQTLKEIVSHEANTLQVGASINALAMSLSDMAQFAVDPSCVYQDSG